MDKFVKVYEIKNDNHNDKIFEKHPKYLKFLGIVEQLTAGCAIKSRIN